MNNMQTIKNELRTIRNLSKHGISSDLIDKYKILFLQLPDLEKRVMEECYINGKSYKDCARKISYCERQIFRIVRHSISLINEQEKEQ